LGERPFLSPSVVGSGSAQSGKPATEKSGAIAPSKVSAIVEDPSDEDVFVLAGKLQALLEGKSKKTCLKALTLVGSLRGIQCSTVVGFKPTPAVTVPLTKVRDPETGRKRLPPPPAKWKQTEAYKSLSAQRDMAVKAVKAASLTSSSIEEPVKKLRSLELSLKTLKLSQSGE